VLDLASRGGGRRVVLGLQCSGGFYASRLRVHLFDAHNYVRLRLFLLLAFATRVRYPTVTDQRSVSEAQRSNVRQNQTSSKNQAPGTAAQ
jgi:hypothetical protein